MASKSHFPFRVCSDLCRRTFEFSSFLNSLARCGRMSESLVLFEVGSYGSETILWYGKSRSYIA